MEKARKIDPDLEKQLLISNEMRQLIASLHLEGIELSPESMTDVRLFDAGKLTKAEFLNRAIGRAQSKSN